MFDYKLSFSEGSDNIIMIAPNGYGKTAFLSLINVCLQFRLLEAASKSFKTLEVQFADETRWEFVRTPRPNIRKAVEDQLRYAALPSRRYYRQRRTEATVEVKFFDKLGKSIKTTAPKQIDAIPADIIGSAIENVLPVHRIGLDTFIDAQTDESLSAAELFQRYYSELIYNDHFRQMIGPFESQLFPQHQQSVNCVFIETQRLLLTQRAERSDAEKKTEPQEEILRQRKLLSQRIESTYSGYAATSQGLDRTFPNRLIDLAGSPGAPDVNTLRTELGQIEKRRAALTAAGILDETSTPIRPPEGEHFSQCCECAKDIC
jgi:predicted ATP-binding protein involved in virulence